MSCSPCRVLFLTCSLGNLAYIGGISLLFGDKATQGLSPSPEKKVSRAVVNFSYTTSLPHTFLSCTPFWFYSSVGAKGDGAGVDQQPICALFARTREKAWPRTEVALSRRISKNNGKRKVNFALHVRAFYTRIHRYTSVISKERKMRGNWDTDRKKRQRLWERARSG